MLTRIFSRFIHSFMKVTRKLPEYIRPRGCEVSNARHTRCSVVVVYFFWCFIFYFIIFHSFTLYFVLCVLYSCIEYCKTFQGLHGSHFNYSLSSFPSLSYALTTCKDIFTRQLPAVWGEAQIAKPSAKIYLHLLTPTPYKLQKSKLDCFFLSVEHPVHCFFSDIALFNRSTPLN